MQVQSEAFPKITHNKTAKTQNPATNQHQIQQKKKQDKRHEHVIRKILVPVFLLFSLWPIYLIFII